MGEIDFRPAATEDFDFLLQLHRATLKDYVEQTWGWDDAWQLQRFRQRFKPNACQIIVFRGKDVGVISILRRETDLFLSNIAVLPAYQGHGIGTFVVKGVLSEAKQLGLPVALQVLKVNPARNLYERLGFTITGENETHFFMKATP